MIKSILTFIIWRRRTNIPIIIWAVLRPCAIKLTNQNQNKDLQIQKLFLVYSWAPQRSKWMQLK